MAITLNHTVVPAHDKEASARFFADIFGLTYEGPMGHFVPVRVNDALTMDFDNRERFESHHYAFHVKRGRGIKNTPPKSILLNVSHCKHGRLL